MKCSRKAAKDKGKNKKSRLKRVFEFCFYASFFCNLVVVICCFVSRQRLRIGEMRPSRNFRSEEERDSSRLSSEQRFIFFYLGQCRTAASAWPRVTRQASC
jgi:hypothetical protein